MLSISYTTYEDEYHFNFNFDNTEMIFAIKDSNILKFLEFIKKSFSVPFKSYFEEDINNLKLHIDEDILSISYNDIRYEVKYNNEIIKSLENFYKNFGMTSKPLKVDDDIKEELTNYIINDQ
jgi:hypothetical protein